MNFRRKRLNTDCDHTVKLRAPPLHVQGISANWRRPDMLSQSSTDAFRAANVQSRLPLASRITPWKAVPSLLFGRQPIKCVPDRLSDFGIFNRKGVERRMVDVDTEILREPWPYFLNCDTVADLFSRELTLDRIVELCFTDRSRTNE